MQHPDIITHNILLQLPPPGHQPPHNLTLCTGGEGGEGGEPDRLVLTVLLTSLALLLLCILCLVCLGQQEDKEELRMMVVSQLVLATGLLVFGVAGREYACRVERRVVCNLLAMLSYTGHLASLAWWSVAASSLLVSVRQLSSQLLQTLIWGSVILACIAAFTGRGVEVETVTGLCQMKEQLMSSQIPSAIFLIISILLLVAGLIRKNQEKCRQTMLVSYLYFFIFLGVFITDIWTDIHGQSGPSDMFVLGYLKLSLRFLQIGLSPLIVITTNLVTAYKSKDKAFSSGETSNLRSSASETRDTRHNIISTRTLISNIST